MKRTPESVRASDLAKAQAILAVWRFRQGPTQRELCKSHGISYSRFTHLAHWNNDAPPLGAVVAERRSATKCVRQSAKGGA